MNISPLQMDRKENISAATSDNIPSNKEKSAIMEPEDSVTLRRDNSVNEYPKRYFIDDLEQDGYMDIIIQDPELGIYGVEIGDEEEFFSMKPGTERTIFPAPLFNNEWELVGTGEFYETLHPVLNLLFQHRKTGKIVMHKGAGNKDILFPDVEEVFNSEVKDRKVVAVCDVNNDKRSDILWQKDDGTVHAWLMDGSKIVEEKDFQQNPNSGPEWHVVGAGHFHSGGRNDLVLQKDDGATKIELYDGMKFLSEHDLYASGCTNFICNEPYPFDSKIACVGDANDDGHSDILSEGNQNSLWLSVMKGTKEEYCLGI